MKELTIIKNMVCPRCIKAVEGIFTQMGLSIIDIQLGKVSINVKISPKQRLLLKEELRKQGFELLDNKHAQLINSIKSIVVQTIQYGDETLTVNFSTLLSEELHYDYAHLSRLFSTVEGRTIERYIITQKIEKVKELMTYDELTLSEIAYSMGYSSTAHLSGQFKKIIGMSPTAFKKLHQQPRTSLDQL